MGGSGGDTYLRFCNLLLPRDVTFGLKVDETTGQVTFFIGEDFQVRPELQTKIPLDQIEAAIKAFAAGQDFVVESSKVHEPLFQVGEKVVAHDKLQHWYEGVVKSIQRHDKYEIQFDGWSDVSNFIQTAFTIRRKLTAEIDIIQLTGSRVFVRDLDRKNGRCQIIPAIDLKEFDYRTSDIVAIL